MPQALLLLLGAIGAIIIVKLFAREWRRVNAELDEVRAKPARTGVTDLRRDPATGVYRPLR